MRKRKKLEFKTKRHVEKAKKKKYYLIFFIVLIVFGAVSTLVLLNSVNFDLTNLFEGRETETVVEQTTLKAETVTSGNSNFLAMSVSDDGKSMRFIAVINADLTNKRIRVATLSPGFPAEFEGKFSTLEEHFQQGGALQVAAAIRNLSKGQISIQKYAYSNDKGFKDALKIIDKAGKFTVRIKETINHNDDNFKLFIPAGDKSFSGETLLQYFYYLGLASTEDGLLLQAQTIRDMLEFYINKANVEQGEELFGLLYNSMEETDITGFDFNNSKTSLENLVALEDTLKFSVEQNFVTFVKSDTPITREDAGS